MKSAYFDEVFEELDEEIKEKTEDFPDFREELYNKLYTFLKEYFTDSGSILYKRTTPDSNIYEKVYDNEKDVSLFWKTNVLYYVKTEKIWESLTIEDYGNQGKSYDVEFDVSELEGKRGNIEKGIIFELGSTDEDRVVFNVKRPSHGSKTKTKDIRKELNKEGIPFDRDDLEHLFKTYKKQNEVDFFINKDAEQFLKEQFDLWIKHYVMNDETVFEADRLKKLKILREIAYKIIDFVSQFEDELVKIWNKPKFALNSNYVITLNRMVEKEGGKKVIRNLLSQDNFKAQVEEWKKLGIIEEDREIKSFFENENGQLKKEYRFLPIDTKYFDKETRFKILSLFEDLDEDLDGWVIKSENYQALKTILPKFRNEIKTIYIDPPYNTGSDEFMYRDRFRSSSWLTLMENRLDVAKELMSDSGVFFVSIANSSNYYSETYKLGMLLDNLFEKRFADLVWKRRGGAGSYTISDITELHEYILSFGMDNAKIYSNIMSPERMKEFKHEDEEGRYKWHDLVINQYTKDERPNMYYGVVYDKEKDVLDFEKEPSDLDESTEEIIFPSKTGKSVFTMTKKSMKEVWERGDLNVIKENGEYRIKIKKYLKNENGLLDGYPLRSILSANDLPYKIGGTSSATREMKRLFGDKVYDSPKPVNLIRLLCYTTTIKDDIILDFFAGSGTTAEAVMRLNKEDGGSRKFIMVDMEDYLEEIISSRIKKISYSLNWEDSKPQDLDGIGVFFKYYSLEQYEQALKNCSYEPSEPFEKSEEPTYDQYVFSKDKKMLDAVELDFEEKEEKVDFSKLYPNIDLAETLSNLKGKKIKQMTEDSVTFEEGETLEYDDLDFETIKPLIWW